MDKSEVMGDASYDWGNLSDPELQARLVQRGLAREIAVVWVRNRDNNPMYAEEITRFLEGSA